MRLTTPFPTANGGMRIESSAVTIHLLKGLGSLAPAGLPVASSAAP